MATALRIFGLKTTQRGVLRMGQSLSCKAWVYNVND